jgi:hypothetical protein
MTEERRRERKFIGISAAPPKKCECGARLPSTRFKLCPRCSQRVHNIRMSEKHLRQRRERAE